MLLDARFREHDRGKTSISLPTFKSTRQFSLGMISFLNRSREEMTFS